jgi:hypothetical protein
MKRPVSVLALLFLLVTSAIKLQAQENFENKWKFLVEAYLMFPYMNGSTGVGNLPKVDVDANAGDIFSNLKVGAMLYVEGSNNNWAVSSDIIYMDLRQDVTPNVLVESGELSAKQFAWELSGLRRVAPWLEVGIGGRLNNMKAGLELVKRVGNPREEDRSLNKTWVDPIIIVRSKGIVNEKWLLQFRGDLGGFGIGSDFAWQLQAYAGYQFSKLFQLTAGYRIISMDYDKGSGRERFVYDINTFGPVVRLGFNF